MKTVDWARLERIEYEARRIILKNPEIAEESTAKSMLFLLDMIQILRAQRDSFLQQLREIRMGSRAVPEIAHD
jgi:hypothetical protein